MNYCSINYTDIANGPGVRVSLFVSGCRNRCKGCFQPETWDFNYGQEFTQEVMDDIITHLKPNYISGLTILGGDPFEPENEEGLIPLIRQIRRNREFGLVGKTIWYYTGYTYENLIKRHSDNTNLMIGYSNVIVDGPFIESQKDITLQYRGSKNQRIIDVIKTVAKGEIVLWQDKNKYS